jgi:hypothetical protein
MAWMYVCGNTPDDGPEQSCAIIARAHKRTWARLGFKGCVHVHIVGDERTVGPDRGPCAIKLETEITLSNFASHSGSVS